MDIPMRYERLVKILCLIMLAATVGAILILAAVPPLSRDALTHHLYVPKLYLENGGIYEIPWVEFSYFPMNLDLLYIVPLAFGNDIIPKYIHFSFALLTALLIYLQLKKWYRPIYGWIGSLMFLSIPIVVKLAISVYVDLGLVFFSTLSLTSLVAWMEKPARLKHLIISAVGAGLALGTKYNGLVVCFIIGLAVPMVYQKIQNDSECKREPLYGFAIYRLPAVKLFLLHSMIALLLFSPWALRNAYWTGNPLYPLYNGFFNKIQISEMSSKDRNQEKIREAFRHKKPLDHFSVRRMVYHESWLEIALSPIRIFFQGKDNEPRYFDGKLNPMLLFFPILAFLGWRADQFDLRIAKLLLLGFSLSYLMIVFLTTDLRVRYIAPILPPLIILTICGLHNVIDLFNRRSYAQFLQTGFVIIFISGLFIPAAYYIFNLNKHYFPLDYIGSRIDRDAYIEHFWPEYVALKFINRNLPEDARILSIFGGNRGYYADRKIFFNNQMLEQLLENSHTSKDIAQALKKMQFTHLMINYEMYNQWISSRLTARQRQIALSFFRDDMNLLFRKNSHMIFEL
jgi:4-amino-4-deoxy-L-arabinose transferase-like glycosyltransferase